MGDDNGLGIMFILGFIVGFGLFGLLLFLSRHLQWVS
jgi:hypothetical protein